MYYSTYRIIRKGLLFLVCLIGFILFSNVSFGQQTPRVTSSDEQEGTSFTACTGSSLLLMASCDGFSPIWQEETTENPRIIESVMSGVTSLSVRCEEEDEPTIITVIGIDCEFCSVPPSATNFHASGTLGAGNCSVQLSATASGRNFQFTGPGGYVFSNAYRYCQENITVYANDVKLPGIYYLKVDGGGEPITYTIEVGGTACSK